METVRVSIVYRPLRICWAIKAGDFQAFREAIRINHALWGGRFNPIVVVDHVEEALAIVEAFRPDMIRPVGTSEEVQAFASRFKYLMSPFIPDSLFFGEDRDAQVQALDIQNAISSRFETPEWSHVKQAGACIYRWEDTDPLADIFLMHFGAYPRTEDVGIDYESMFKESLDATEVAVSTGNTVLCEGLEHPTIAYLSRHGLKAHYSMRTQWSWPGFFIGRAADLDDLVTFWNLRACDVSALFVDRDHVDRYTEDIPRWKKNVSELTSGRRFPDEHSYAIWWRSRDDAGHDRLEELRALIGTEPCIACSIDRHRWGGNALVAPLMHLGESASLGVLNDDGKKPKLSFGLSNRPYATDAWLFSQLLVASVSFIGGLHGHDGHTFDLPYIPELNEFFARAIHLHYSHLRVESGRIGIVIRSSDTDTFVYALSTSELFKRVFELAGFDASVSSSGLIARQLIAQLGGLQGARVFKIPGARRLLKMHGPLASFMRKGALQLIGGRDPDNPEATFSDHQDLFLEPRAPGEKLTPSLVFSYLVNQGLFRMGADLLCPRCQLRSWFPVDDLRQSVPCQMCGETFPSTVQLMEGDWSYRRSGLLGTERNAQGAVPVVLTLQQLDANIDRLPGRSSYSVSLDLKPKNGQLRNPCEVDFAWIVPREYPERTTVIIGECKDRGYATDPDGDGGTINRADIENLRAVADAFPKDRFEVFILLAKLCPFTPNETELAKTLNGQYQCRVIMLTDRELEPYHLYERTKKFFAVKSYGSSAADLARTTVDVFLNPKPLDLGTTESERE
ncbi:hypothetical protein [Ralstonia sp. Ralssp110]|uniref:hypothetical protein n=1 Tax=Ralstonia sp. Ralssp110 TaxID=3243004 RepID=UPI0039B6C5BE